MIGVSQGLSSAVAISRGDLNKDGIPDLLLANNGGGNSSALTALLGNGDGTFRPAIDSAPNSSAFGMATGDFNGDGILDAAVAGYTQGTQGVLEIMLGNGDGTFGNSQTISLSNIPNAIAVADLNADGKLDIALTLDKVYFFKGNGDGTVTASGSIAVGGQNQSLGVVTGDFNGDGNADLAVSDAFNVYVLWNTGGSFQFNVTKVASYPSEGGIFAADVNQDHHTDLLTVYYTCLVGGSPACPAWEVLLGGKGQQTLTRGFAIKPNTTYPAFYAQTVADFNGDGFNDVAVLAQTGFALVWLGKADGTFQANPTVYRTGAGASSTAMTSSDLNRDGKIDLAVANGGNEGLSVMLNATRQATSCAASTVSPSVNECQPVNDAYYNSPLHLTAKATDTGHSVTSMQVYINGTLYVTRDTDSLTYQTSLADNSYLVVIKAWDQTGNSFETDRNINIYTGTPGQTCATPANSVNICLPKQNETTSSPVQVFANSDSFVPITSVQVYIDNALLYNDTSSSTYVDTSFSLTSGPHSIVVKAWDNDGNVYSQSRNITVQ
jgi:hypothetical protein